MSAGSFAGALGAGFLSDRIGRKHSIQVAAVIWIIGSMVTCSAHNVAQLVAGRVINGLSVGVKYHLLLDAPLTLQFIASSSISCGNCTETISGSSSSNSTMGH